MKYAQGSFITVPSKSVLSGLHPTAQALYMWLCSYANETGKCFPSRKTLANDCGCSENSIDRMLELLQKKGLILKRNQKKGEVYTSNLYTVLIIESSPTQHPPSPHTAPTVPPDVRSNSIQLTKFIEGGSASALPVRYVSDSEKETETSTRVIPYPYSVEATREAWRDGELRLQILEWYLTEKGLWKVAVTKPKLQAIMRRHSKSAERIAKAAWSKKELREAKTKMLLNDKLLDEWTLDTLEKYLTK